MKISDGAIILLLCFATGFLLVLNFFNSGHINQKNLSVDKPISINIYNEAFDNGVSCGVDALMFFVKQGKKEIDINAVYNKAQEIRKEKNEVNKTTN